MMSSRWPRPIGRHGVDGLDAGLQRLVHRLAADDARRLHLEASHLGGVRSGPCRRSADRGALTTRPIERVADRHREDAAGRLDRAALLDVARLTEDDRTDRLLVEVQGEPEGAALELEHLVHRGVGEALRPGRCRRRPRAHDRPGPSRGSARTWRRACAARAAISSALMVNSAMSDLLPQLLEPVTDGAVDHDVAHPGDDAAEHRRVDDDLHLDVLLALPGSSASRSRSVCSGVERDRAADLGDRVLAARPPRAPRTGRRSRAARWRGRRRRSNDASATLAWQRLAAEQVLDHRHPPFGGQRGIGERDPQLVGRPRRSARSGTARPRCRRGGPRRGATSSSAWA